MNRFRVLAAVLCLVAGPLWSAQDLVGALDRLRGAHGLPLPVFSEGISAACLSRARALAASGVLSHNDEAGRGPGVQMLFLGFPPGDYGEVLGSGADWEAVWKAWLASKPHREVLTAAGWTLWGWAAVESGQTTVWVVRFYRP